MPELDADSIVDQVTMIGLVSREQLREASADAEDGSPEAVLRMLLRKGWLTSWQVDRLKKGDPTGFFYGDAKVLFHLAEGTFARVYRGVHTGSGQAIAIKVLRQRFATIPDAVHRFHQEAEAGIRLRHDNIVRIIDVGQQDNRHFMIMEYVEGMNLRDFLRLRGKTKPQQAVPLMLGMAQGLKYSLSQGVTHRDIKGTNILISNSGVAKLVDFGLATIEGDEGKSSVKSQRTVDYSALERTCKSPKGDPRSDIYFLGCVFYQMLTGQLPMEESESKDMLKKMLVRSFGAIKPISEHPYAPGEELSAIIEKMMKIDLKFRYQTMDEVVADLERYHASHDAITGKAAAKAGPADEDDGFDSIFIKPVEEEIVAEPAAAPLPFEVKAVVPKSILCVEAQDEIQDVLRKTLTRMGYRAFVVRDAEVAAERYRESPVDAVIFDTDGQGDDAIDALIDMHDKAHEDEHKLVALVLLGPRQGELKEKLPADDNIIVLSKPLKMKDVQESIHLLLPAH
ncbi:MAG: protein kinase domain-containing protein [Isosphaeraceae bacterium]